MLNVENIAGDRSPGGAATHGWIRPGNEQLSVTNMRLAYANFGENVLWCCCLANIVSRSVGLSNLCIVRMFLWQTAFLCRCTRALSLGSFKREVLQLLEKWNAWVKCVVACFRSFSPGYLVFVFLFLCGLIVCECECDFIMVCIRFF